MPVATADALMGVGMPAQQAAMLGGNPSALTCTGTSSGTAATIRSKNTEVVAASSQTGAILPTGAPIMEPYFITASASTSAVIYLPSGHTFNISGAPTSVTLAQFKSIIMWQYKRTAWCYVILA